MISYAMKSRKTLQSGLHVIIWKEKNWFVARCLEVEIASQGKTKKEALKNIEEAIELYFEDEKLPLPERLPMLELHDLPLKSHYA